MEPHLCRGMLKNYFQLLSEKNDDGNKIVIEEAITNSPGRVSFTSDNWKPDRQKYNYICITAHYIDAKWKLHKRTIGSINCIHHLIWFLLLMKCTCAFVMES